MISLGDYTKGLIEKEGVFFSNRETQVSYPEHGNNIVFEIEDQSFWFKHRNNCITEAVLKYAPNQVFFDIGGGNGFVTKALEEKGVSAVLVEPGFQGCYNAKKRNVKNIVCASLESNVLIPSKAPSIGLFDVVEHIEQDIAFLSQVHHCLKEGGLVFITVPAYNLLWSTEDDYAGHFRRYTVASICNKLKAAGFDIEYSTYIFSVSPPAVFLFRTIPSWLGFNKNQGLQKKPMKAHKYKGGGLLKKLLTQVWRMEVNNIKEGKRTPFGGSCFVVARKRAMSS